MYNDLFSPKFNLAGHELDVSHKCLNKLRINIDHLILGTNCINCNRGQYGSDNICIAAHHPHVCLS